MAYRITVNLHVTNDDRDDLVQMSREYRITDLAEITGVIEHAGRSLALASEGVEKLGLQDSHEEVAGK